MLRAAEFLFDVECAECNQFCHPVQSYAAT
jgi:hypothetical protein